MAMRSDTRGKTNITNPFSRETGGQQTTDIYFIFHHFFFHEFDIWWFGYLLLSFRSFFLLFISFFIRPETHFFSPFAHFQLNTFPNMFSSTQLFPCVGSERHHRIPLINVKRHDLEWNIIYDFCINFTALRSGNIIFSRDPSRSGRSGLNQNNHRNVTVVWIGFDHFVHMFCSRRGTIFFF